MTILQIAQSKKIKYLIADIDNKNDVLRFLIENKSIKFYSLKDNEDKLRGMNNINIVFCDYLHICERLFKNVIDLLQFEYKINFKASHHRLSIEIID